MKQRLLSLLLCGAMLFSMCTPAAAVEQTGSTGGLCRHHLEHSDEVCGYIEAVEGHLCGHVHDEGCGYVEAVPEVPCDKDCTDTDGDGQIDHVEGCAYTPAVKDAPCQHEHDELCGYVAAVVGQPCGYACPICSMQAANDLPMLTAAGDVSYLDYDESSQNWQTGTKASGEYAAVTADTTAWGTENATTWYVASGEVTISSRVTVIGEIYLILANGCNLTVNGGINVGEGQSLTIYGQSNEETAMGKLTATASSYTAAGIGGRDDAGGTTTINGGAVTATGATGIGGGIRGDGGIITINGGMVTAKSMYDGAGIGGGYRGAGGTITISGGTVMAESRTGTGIGGGSYSSSGGTFSTGRSGNAVIMASSISDTSGKDSSWSGVIFEGDSGQVYGDSVTLTTDATIPTSKALTVPAGKTLAIGEGKTLTNNGTISNRGTISGNWINNGTTINCGTINGTPAGSGNLIDGKAEIQNVEYLDDKGMRKKLSELPGDTSVTFLVPGMTQWDNGWYVVRGDVTIERRAVVSGDVHLILTDGCNLTVNGGIHVMDDDRDSSNGSPNSLTIYAQSTGDSMGAVTAQNADLKAAGIGGGNWQGGGTVTINGGRVTAIGGGNTAGGGGAGIGGGDCSPGGTVTINGGIVTATGGDGSSGYSGGAGIGGGGVDNRDWTGGTGGNVTINGGTVIATGGSGAKSGAGIGSGGSGNNTDPGEPGTFATSPNGGAVIIASSISDQSGRDVWSGMIFEGTADGKVYGDPTLTTDATIPENKTLVIEEGHVITIGEGVTLTNRGTITNNGTIINNGNLVGNAISGSGIVHTHTLAAAWSSDTTYHWHECTVADCPATNNSQKGSYAAHRGGTTTCAAQAVCAVCGASYGEKNSSNHTSGTEVRGAIEATETAEGYTGDTYCLGCGVKIATGTTIPKKNSEPAPPATYTVTVNGGTGGGSYAAGDTVTITATIPSGQRFTGWTVNAGGVTLANASSATTTFTMPAQAVTVTANFQTNSGGNYDGGGTYTPPTYPPTVEKPSGGGGTPSTSPSNPEQGDTVTVTSKPDEGYEVDTITVTDRNGKPVEVTQRPDGTYTFKQPSGKVTVKVTYRPTDRPWNNPFTDVSEGDWYYEAVRFVQERGLMNGYSDGRFGPNDNLSRAQLAQILFNKEGRPGVNYLLTFSDVAGEAWYTEAIRWATSQGIVSGYGNGRFGPNDPITREQLAVMLWRYSGSPAATNKELHFADADEISPFALEAMRWAVENGILNGYGDGRLGPQGQATRAQVAQMLKNFIENQEENT